jgi:hypothetical protein
VCRCTCSPRVRWPTPAHDIGRGLRRRKQPIPPSRPPPVCGSCCARLPSGVVSTARTLLMAPGHHNTPHQHHNFLEWHHRRAQTQKAFGHRCAGANFHKFRTVSQTPLRPVSTDTKPLPQIDAIKEWFRVDVDLAETLYPLHYRLRNTNSTMMTIVIASLWCN